MKPIANIKKTPSYTTFLKLNNLVENQYNSKAKQVNQGTRDIVPWYVTKYTCSGIKSKI